LIADIDTTGSVAQSAILRVTNNGMPFFETTLRLPGSAQRVALTIPPIDPGMHRLEFTLLAPQDDALPDNRQRVLVQEVSIARKLVSIDLSREVQQHPVLGLPALKLLPA
jgi:hypothetical protein